MGLEKMIPLPAFLAYDAFNGDIPAKIIYEQIQDIDEEDNQNSYYDFVRLFLRTVHTSQKLSAATVELPAQLFQARATREAKQYLNEMLRNLFPGISNPTSP